MTGASFAAPLTSVPNSTVHLLQSKYRSPRSTCSEAPELRSRYRLHGPLAPEQVPFSTVHLLQSKYGYATRTLRAVRQAACCWANWRPALRTGKPHAAGRSDGRAPAPWWAGAIPFRFLDGRPHGLG